MKHRYNRGTPMVPPMHYQDGTSYSQQALQGMWNDPYAESRFFGPVAGLEHADESGNVPGVQAPNPNQGMPDEVKWNFSLPGSAKDKRWEKRYGNFYDSWTGKLFTPDEYAAHHGFPEEVPPVESESVPPVNVNHPDFCRQHPLHPANRDIAAPDPSEHSGYGQQYGVDQASLSEVGGCLLYTSPSPRDS